ncbi:Myrcene synthase, chloroplastic, putative isoform 1 [Theobroma cacao]|uniref:(+)-delta-cadinene synthase n=1 Tax=Theobroma cacao TaxID=3641 RepID=A0A061DQZ8_THECC|nr:Myrcene synthase, chloroplastic, putative isoform 1 [Theobroma cacao]
MSLHFHTSVPASCFNRTRSKDISNRSNANKFIVLQARKHVATAKVFDENIARRTANYHPPIWTHDYIQSLQSDFVGESCDERAMKLVAEVRTMLDRVLDPLEKLELVDTLQRLGLSYHYENDTKRILESVNAEESNVVWKKGNLYATALEFRLLRQHGYKVTPEVFSSFMDEMGNFKAGLCEDCKGLLNLYEASYHLVEGESILENARDFAAKHLKQCLKQNKDEYQFMLVEHALELPLHWRIERLEARWFIDVYERREDKIPILLELAKLDFNIVQAVHQDDLRYASNYAQQHDKMNYHLARGHQNNFLLSTANFAKKIANLKKSGWWTDLGLGEKLTFARDRLMGNFLWTVGVASDPQFGHARRTLTKINALITIIDDVYDVYGTLDELELFTEAVERWDVNAMELLPEYMKICFLALYNSINEMAFDTIKEQGFDSIPFLKEMWADLCKAYLVEAKWYYGGYTPTLKEYIDNAWISISAPVILSHAYFLTNSIRKECLECLKEHSQVVYCTSMILRLVNDLETSSDELERGDVPKSIQCYMHETGFSKEEARHYIRNLIDATWKMMNENRIAQSPFSQTFIQIALNLARMAQCMYQYGDGHGIEVNETNNRVLSLLVLPIPLQLGLNTYN